MIQIILWIKKKMKKKMTQEPKDISSLFQKDYSNAMDLRGNPIGDICLCG